MAKQTKPQFRRPPRENIHGIILLNKPVGVSSNGILQQVVRLFNAKKGGHTGALDPFASGLLPICLGEATKVSGLLLEADKRYTATLKLGECTDTGDTEGEVVETQAVPALTAEKIEQVLAQFMGESEQVPPMYSALKFQGKPLYHYARQGIEIERSARKITISALNLISFDQQQIVFDVLCSKGTYVRTLGEDIAKALGTVGHLTALHRTQTGSLKGDDMLTIEQIEAQGKACLLPLDIALQHLQRINLNAAEIAAVKMGQKVNRPQPETDLVRFYDENGTFFAVGEWLHDVRILKPKRVFNLDDAEVDRAVAENA
ncbi:MAG: tRNA pseudouridine(55) synthase TruB [Thiotrichales bacterium]|nr:tRNA pseudouridine(55) synthase TruB [Thiotrichales bacterium]